MIRIAVVDDEIYAIDNLVEKLYAIEKTFEEKLQIFSFSSGEELLNKKIRSDIIFLDIEMPGIDGISLAQALREYDPNVRIVYVTNYHQYWKKAYKVHAFEYLEKPYDTEDIRQILNDYLKSISASENETIDIELYNGKKIIIAVKEIIYISCGSKKRQLILIAENNEYICKGMISDIYLKLNDIDFFMPHRSHIINFNHLKSYKKNSHLIMSNDDAVPLSKGKTEEFERMFARSLHNKVSGYK